LLNMKLYNLKESVISFIHDYMERWFITEPVINSIYNNF